MIDRGAHPVLGVRVHAVDYEAAVSRVLGAARNGERCAVSALAVHGVMTGALDSAQRRRLNSLDLLVPDGHPVRWALRWLHGVSLPDRVRGPTLMLLTCEAAAREGVPVFLYGSTPDTLSKLQTRLESRVPGLRVAGATPSAFGRLSEADRQARAERIRSSGARIVFVGLGCPRQEIWMFENGDALRLPMIAVGAAFDFHAGTVPEAPAWMQRNGLEWLFRLASEPRRLWRRYVLLNPLYLLMVAGQRLGLVRIDDGASGAPVRTGTG